MGLSLESPAVLQLTHGVRLLPEMSASFRLIDLILDPTKVGGQLRGSWTLQLRVADPRLRLRSLYDFGILRWSGNLFDQVADASESIKEVKSAINSRLGFFVVGDPVEDVVGAVVEEDLCDGCGRGIPFG